MSRGTPAAGPGSKPPLSSRLRLSAIMFRRSAADNDGLPDDTMPATTARFRAENGLEGACGASLSARCFNGVRGCRVHS